MSKVEFISIFELTLVSANLDIIGLSLIDDSHVQIAFKGGGTRKVNIEGDSYGAIILDVINMRFEENIGYICAKITREKRFMIRLKEELRHEGTGTTETISDCAGCGNNGYRRYAD